MLIEHITAFVLSILGMVGLGIIVLVALTIWRRQRRDVYFERLDALRDKYHAVIAATLRGEGEYGVTLKALKEVSGPARLYVLEQLILGAKPTADQAPVARQLCEDLGLVRLWQQQLSGRFGLESVRLELTHPDGALQRIGPLRFLVRAKSAENLGVVRHHDSWPLLVKALDDPHPDVRAVAVRSLAAIGEPASIPAILERLQGVVLNPEKTNLSLRTVKTALVSFPLSQVILFLGTLQHAHRRVRFLGTDIIREMVERQGAWQEDFTLDVDVFSADAVEIFLTRLCFDENPDVRARAAPVIAYMNDVRATPVLLALLEDAVWFVRLHAVRALDKPKFLPQLPQLAQRLTDPNWLVRESTVRTVLSFGPIGVDKLSEHFLDSPDRYSREQIADEFQRGGVIPGLLTQYGKEIDGRATHVVETLAQMGKTSYIVEVLEQGSDRAAKKKFLLRFGRTPDPRIQPWVHYLAENESDDELRSLAQNFAMTAAR